MISKARLPRGRQRWANYSSNILFMVATIAPIQGYIAAVEKPLAASAVPVGATLVPQMRRPLAATPNVGQARAWVCWPAGFFTVVGQRLGLEPHTGNDHRLAEIQAGNPLMHDFHSSLLHLGPSARGPHEDEL
jgi:hypothetical protein